MGNFEILFRKSVSGDLKSIPKQDVKRILERINSLRDDPRPPGSTKLSGQEYYRVRQGNYRIVYEIQDTHLVIVVIKIGHRREIYR